MCIQYLLFANGAKESVAAGSWCSAGCGQRGDRFKWQVMHDDFHLCVIMASLLVFALFVHSEKKRMLRTRETELTEVVHNKHAHSPMPEYELGKC